MGAAFVLLLSALSAPGYEARATGAARSELVEFGARAWSKAAVIGWGPDEYATSFRALWTADGLAIRFDVTDPSPWYTLRGFDERLWNEEVVELFLDVGASGRSYAELEINPANAAVDLWVDRAENRFDKDWNIAGLESRVRPLRDPSGRTIGWQTAAFLPWTSLAGKAPAGTALPPRPGDRWRFNVFRIERPGGPAEPEKGALYFAWSPTGQRSFHVPQAFRELAFVAGKGADASSAAPARRPVTPSVAIDCREKSRLAMGCTATVRACGDAAALAPAIDSALDEIDRLDRLLSHYLRDSALSRLNREAASGPVAVPPELFSLLEQSLRWSRESDGAFDVTVGPLMKAWGFFRDEGHVPSADALARARRSVGYRHVVLDPAVRTARFDTTGVELDLGGIGKGYAVERAVSVLRSRGVRSALVNLGGSSVYGLGAPPGARAWEIELQDPARPDRFARAVRLRDRALSVAGGYQRFFQQDGITYAHIMDPRRGRPVQGVLSVAVLADSATDGDALDDVFFVQGLDWSRSYVGRHPGTEVLFFLPAGAAWKLVTLGADRSASLKRRP